MIVFVTLARYRISMEDAVDIHLFSLDVPPERLRDLFALLSPDEQERAARLRGTQNADRFRAARGLLRETLATALSLDPRTLRFARGLRGKPYLSYPRGGPDFSLSHSEGVALLALTRGRRVGIDIERIRTDIDFEGIARLLFSPAEAAPIAACPQEERAAAFFRAWVRREAYGKALGHGLSVHLDAEQGVCAPGWSILDLAVDPAFAAALVVELSSAEGSAAVVSPAPALRFATGWSGPASCRARAFCPAAER